MQKHLKMLPTSREVVSADGNSLGPIGEVHVQFRIGKLVFNNMISFLDYLGNEIIELLHMDLRR